MKNIIILLLLSHLFTSCKEGKTIELEHKIIGSGGPTVIFENGMASTFETWKTIPDSIAKHSQVLIYNRAGLGNSEISESKSSIPNMVEDLKNLIDKNNLDGPFILVAHSMGSYLTRYFALEYPEQVKGILLVDPSPDKMYDEYTQKERDDFLSFGNENFKDSNQSVKAEWQEYLENRKYVQKQISNKIPMIILSATQWDFFKYHRSILNQNSKTTHLKIEGSHDLHQDRPEIIIDQINNLLQLE